MLQMLLDYYTLLVAKWLYATAIVTEPKSRRHHCPVSSSQTAKLQ